MNPIARLFRRAHQLLKQSVTLAIPVSERLARSAIAYRLMARIAQLQGRSRAFREYVAIASGYAEKALQRGFRNGKGFAL